MEANKQRGLAAIAIIAVVIGLYAYQRVALNEESKHHLSIEKMVSIGKLELIRINIKDVLTQTKERPFLPLPDAKALLIVAGEVYAGIDLAKMKPEDIVDSETQVTVSLPKPQILMAKVNHGQSRIYDVSWGGWSEVELVESAYKAAEDQILNAAKYSGYVEACKKNARLLLTPLFAELAKKKVVIEFKS